MNAYPLPAPRSRALLGACPTPLGALPAGVTPAPGWAAAPGLARYPYAGARGWQPSLAFGADEVADTVSNIQQWESIQALAAKAGIDANKIVEFIGGLDERVQYALDPEKAKRERWQMFGLGILGGWLVSRFLRR